MLEYFRLSLNVLRHILVVVKVVGRDVGNYSNLGTYLHIHKLKAGKFQYNHIVAVDFFEFAYKRRADVSAYVAVVAGVL